MVREGDEALLELLLESELIHDGRYISLRRDVVRDAGGERRLREIVEHPGAVAMIPLLDDGRVLFVRQYRHAVRQVCLELPAGTLDRDADGGTESPAEAAARELTEETGYSAAHWRRLGAFFTAPGFTTEEMHLYLATELTPVADYAGPAADERLELQPLRWREAVAMAERGDLHDAKTLVGVLWLYRLVQTGELPPPS